MIRNVIKRAGGRAKSKAGMYAFWDRDGVHDVNISA